MCLTVFIFTYQISHQKIVLQNKKRTERCFCSQWLLHKKKSWNQLCCSQLDYLPLLHYLGAAVSFTCICFYTILLTALTKRCVLTGYEKVLYPLRIASTVVQIIVTICCILSDTAYWCQLTSNHFSTKITLIQHLHGSRNISDSFFFA